MTSSQQGALIEGSPNTSTGEDIRLSLPEATMFIVASSGALWVLLFGALNTLIH